MMLLYTRNEAGMSTGMSASEWGKRRVKVAV